jgi:alpha-L-fucosidase
MHACGIPDSASNSAPPLLRSQKQEATMNDQGSVVDARRPGWWDTARFGLFVHWGIYAVPGWHEQHVYRKHLTRAQYVPLMQAFNPTAFDPDEWLDLAESAGMRYLCFTTKHIDGFCMWDTDETEFKITNTPYGRDVLAMLADACHRRNIPLCLYYSVVDNHHPCYPHQGRSYEFPEPQPGDTPDEERYVDFVKRQARELCTRYGRIHGFWWDANVLKRRDPSVNALIRELQPGIAINNRGMDAGDFGTPERDWDATVNTEMQFGAPVEACQSVGFQSWGFRADEDYYSDSHLIGSIQKVLAKGGNYLLNVGPRADGTIPNEARDILTRIGAWFHSVKKALVQAEPANQLIGNRDVLLTRDGNTLYVHLYKEPTTTAVNLHPITQPPGRALLLNTGTPVQTAVRDLPWLHQRDPSRCLSIIDLPVNSPPLTGYVVQLDFDLPPERAAETNAADTDSEFLMT